MLLPILSWHILSVAQTRSRGIHLCGVSADVGHLSVANVQSLEHSSSYFLWTNVSNWNPSCFPTQFYISGVWRHCGLYEKKRVFESEQQCQCCHPLSQCFVQFGYKMHTDAVWKVMVCMLSSNSARLWAKSKHAYFLAGMAVLPCLQSVC